MNPVPVAVLLTPVKERGKYKGILVQQRGIAPAIGEWALPGGHMELGETVEEAAAREMVEETGIVIDPLDINIVSSKAIPGVVLVFCESRAIDIS